VRRVAHFQGEEPPVQAKVLWKEIEKQHLFVSMVDLRAHLPAKQRYTWL